MPDLSSVATAKAALEASAPWEEPIPVEENDLPEFPVDTLPAWIGEYVQAVAACTQAPVDLPAVLALAMLATAAQRRYVVQLSKSHTEQLCLWIMALMDSGERKSPVFGAMRAPVFERQAQLIELGAPRRARAQAELKTAEARLAKSIKEAATAKSATDATVAACARDEAADEIERMTRDIPPQTLLLLDDITPEQFGILMADVGALTIASSEGGVFSTFGGRYNKQVANLDLLLKSYTGDSATVDRVGRERLVIQDPACTFAMAVQPDVMAEVAQRSEWTERGGLARFLYAAPKPRVGTRKGRGPEIPAVAEADYRERMLALLPSEPPQFKANRRAEPVIMRMSPAGLRLWDAFSDALEPRLHRDGGDLAWCKAWASKLAGTLARIAALLQLAEAGPGEVTAGAVKNALGMAPYFEAHATAALRGERAGERDAQQLVRWITREQPETFTERDVYRQNFGEDKARTTTACRYLQERGLIREATALVANSVRWEPHPKLLEVSVLSVVSKPYINSPSDPLSLPNGSNKPNEAKTTDCTPNTPNLERAPTAPTPDEVEDAPEDAPGEHPESFHRAVEAPAALLDADPGDPFDDVEWAQHVNEHDGSPPGQWATAPASETRGRS